MVATCGIIIALALWFSYGTRAESCRAAPIIPNFDLKSMVGTWYVYQTNDARATSKHCMMYNMEDQEGLSDGNFVVKESWKSGDKDESFVIKVTRVQDNQFKSDFMDFKEAQNALIAVDGTFSTWHLCVPDPEEEAIYVMTKDRNPDESTVAKAHDSIIKAGFQSNIDKLVNMDHSGC